MKKRKPKRYYTRTIDLAFLLVLAIAALYFFYQAVCFSILPKKWIWISAICLLLIYSGLFALSLQRTKKWIIIAKRVFITLLCITLCIPAFFLQKSRHALSKISRQEEAAYSELYVITKKDASISSLSELNASSIGFQSGADKENASFAKEILEKDIATMQVVEKMDYTTLYGDLCIGNIQAMVISDTYYRMSKTNIDGFSEHTKILSTLQRKKERKAENKDLREDTFTLYISGLDNMGSPDQQNRSDTNLLLIVNPRANHIDMVSLPRDGYLPNSALNDANDKLTHTGIYGIDASVKTIENFYNIPIDYYARISFHSLIEIVDAMDGIDVDVEISFCEQDENRSFAKEDLICLNKGTQTLNGKEALAYARHRKTKGYDNPGRERAQRRIISAVIDKLMSPSALPYISRLLDIAPDYVLTNMPVSSIADFVSAELEELKPWTIRSISSNNGISDHRYTASLPQSAGTSSVYLFSQDEIHAVTNAYDGASHPLVMSSFSFDLNDLYKDTPPVGTSGQIVWDSMAVHPY